MRCESFHQALGDVLLAGIRSTFRCSASTAARVAGPMAQMRARSARRSQWLTIQPLEEEADAVGAGEDQPVVLVELGDGAIERLQDRAAGWISMVGSSITSRAQRAQPRGESAGLLAGARDHDALAEQRQPFVPVQLLAQPHHFADDDGGGRLHAALEQSARAESRAFRRRSPGRAACPAHRHRRRIGGAAVGDQLARDLVGSVVSPMKITSVSELPDLAPVDLLRRRGR